MTPSPEFIGGITEIVAFLEKHGLVHGAIKPSNLFWNGDYLVLADAASETKKAFSAEEDIVYRAPEILSGGPFSFEGDLYSLGCVLYAVLSRVQIFDDEDLENLRFKALYAQPRSLKNTGKINTSLANAVDALLEKRPENRINGFGALKRVVQPTVRVARRAVFIGREVEFEQITELVRNVSDSRVALIRGCHGSGKTRFLSELADSCRLRGSKVVHVNCAENSDSDVSLYRLIQRLAGITVPDTKDQLSDREIDDVLRSFEPPLQSALFFIDNVDCSDRRAEQVLRSLLSRLPKMKWCLVLGGRQIPPIISDLCTRAVGSARLKSVCLHDLADEAAHAMINFLVNDPAQAAWVASTAGGNPLLIDECSKMSSTRTPETLFAVRSFIAKRVKGLSKPSRELAKILSFFTSPVALGFIHSLQMMVIDSARLELEDAGVLRPREDNLLYIHHAGTRESIYRSIPIEQRCRIHEKIFLLARGAKDTLFSAEHALAAKLYTKAAELFRNEGRRNFVSGSCRAASECFAKAKQSFQLAGSILDSKDQILYILCLARTGKFDDAVRVYQTLRSLPDVKLNASLAAEVYERVGGYEKSVSWADRVEYFESLRRNLSTDSDSWNRSCYQLGIALVYTGDNDKALEALSGARPIEGFEEWWLIESTRVLAFISKGMFKEGLETLRKIEHPALWARSGINNNLALCYEALGDLNKAIEHQRLCLQYAEEGDYAAARILSYSNFGAYACKLGELGEAAESIAKAFEVVRETAISNETLAQKFPSVYADQGQVLVERGLYAHAQEVIQNVNPANDKGRNTLVAMFTHCDLLLRVAATAETRALLHQLGGPSISANAFFRVEHSLLLARAGSNDLEKVAFLDQLLEETRRMSTIYQMCSVLLEKAETHLSLGDRNDAMKACKNSLAISKRNDYRLLTARALLLSGLAAASASEQIEFLEEGLREASEIGLPELVAQTCYHLGSLQLKLGHYFIAQEYLVRSTAVIKELTANVPRKYRQGYLAVHWRQDAGKKLAESMARTMSVLTPISATPVISDDLFTKSLYRLLVTSKNCGSLEDFIPCVIDSLRRTLDRQAVMITRRDRITSWHAAQGNLPDDIRHKILALGETAGPHTEADGRIHQHGPIAWVSFSSHELSGGLCVVLRTAADRLNEREIEYLSLLAEFVGSTIERIGSRHSHIPATAVSSSFGIVGTSPAIKEVLRHIEIAARSPATVLIEGESGTGKELVARAIHQASSRSRGPFVPVDCGAIPETLIESELFGSRRGSFTGAIADRSGMFEAAQGGTIFLDEISNTSSGLQAKLLRVIQEREVRRIGETKGRAIDVRLIAATNTNLDGLVQQRQFRQDLLYRLKVLHIRIPSLRERASDIPQLARAFVDKLNATHGEKKHLTTAFLDRLATISFPGNVRELHNLVERAYFFAKGSTINTVPAETKSASTTQSATVDEVHSWFREMSEGRQNFWSTVHDRYKRRDISREKVVALVDMGLRTCRGSYKSMAAMFQVKEGEYRRFMDFLRRSDCLLDFRPYRKLPL